MVIEIAYERKMTGLSGFPVQAVFSFYPCIFSPKLQCCFTTDGAVHIQQALVGALV